MPAELCPTCGLGMFWCDQDYEWICHGGGEVFNDDELAEVRKRQQIPEYVGGVEASLVAETTRRRGHPAYDPQKI